MRPTPSENKTGNTPMKDEKAHQVEIDAEPIPEEIQQDLLEQVHQKKDLTGADAEL